MKDHTVSRIPANHVALSLQKVLTHTVYKAWYSLLALGKILLRPFLSSRKKASSVKIYIFCKNTSISINSYGSKTLEGKNYCKVKTEAFVVFYFRFNQNGIILIWISMLQLDNMLSSFSENNFAAVFKSLRWFLMGGLFQGPNGIKTTTKHWEGEVILRWKLGFKHFYHLLP